jgi:hypothetical protein
MASAAGAKVQIEVHAKSENIAIKSRCLIFSSLVKVIQRNGGGTKPTRPAPLPTRANARALVGSRSELPTGVLDRHGGCASP